MKNQDIWHYMKSKPGFVKKLGRSAQYAEAKVASSMAALKSFDGIDEAAQVAAAILPGIAAPIAAAVILCCAVPFVRWGTLGQMEEYQEACDEYNAILNDKEETETKLKSLVSCSRKWRDFAAKRLNLTLPPHHIDAPEKEDLNGFAHAVAELEVLRNQEFVEALGKKYGWTGAVGMGGMLAGLLPSATKSCITANLMDTSTHASAPLAVGLVALTLASGIAFGIGQIAMTIYAGNRLRQGYAIDRTLQENRDMFGKHSGSLDEEVQNTIMSMLDKNILFNQKTRIEYGKNTVAGQTLMLSSTVLSLAPGVGTIASLPFVGLGAYATINAAGTRILYEKKEGKFTGELQTFKNSEGEEEEIPYTKERRESTDLSTLLANPKPMDALGSAFKACSDQLAYLKTLSLLRSVVNHSYMEGLSGKYKGGKLAYLEKLVEGEGFGTSLNKDVLEKVKTIFRTNRTAIGEIVELPREKANKALLQNYLNFSKNPNYNKIQVNNDVVIDREDFQNVLKSLTMEEKCPDPLKEKHYEKLAERLIRHTKNALKCVRYDIMDKCVKLSYVEELKEQISNENRKQSVISPPVSYKNFYTTPRVVASQSLKPAANLSGTPKPSDAAKPSFVESITHSVNPFPLVKKEQYRALKTSILSGGELTQERIQVQQKQLDHFRENATHFTEAKRYKEGDSTIIVWDDPETIFKGKAEYQITYRIDDFTGKVSIKYGINASAIIASNSNVEKKVGVRLVEIAEGKHTIFGDNRNQQIEDVAHNLARKKADSFASTLRSEERNSYAARGN